MNICIGIPTGQRAEQAFQVAMAWANRGIRPVVLTWDKDTRTLFLGSDFLFLSCSVDPERKPFGINQNRMMYVYPDWDVWICGADDLWPGEQEDLKDRIELIAGEAGDRLIWVGDGLFNEQCTHPIITRAMYEKEKGKIFDEEFHHNYTDTDLFARMLQKRRVVKCFDIMLDHRHWRSGKTEMDDIYRIGDESIHLDAVRWDKKYKGNFPNVNNAEVLEIEETEDTPAEEMEKV